MLGFSLDRLIGGTHGMSGGRSLVDGCRSGPMYKGLETYLPGAYKNIDYQESETNAYREYVQ